MPALQADLLLASFFLEQKNFCTSIKSDKNAVRIPALPNCAEQLRCKLNCPLKKLDFRYITEIISLLPVKIPVL